MALRRLIDAPPDEMPRTGWHRLVGRSETVLSLDLGLIGPTAVIYLASRPEGDRSDFAWCHLRRIALHRERMPPCA